jgi:hypothetical protein
MVASIGSDCAPIGAHNGESCRGCRARRLDFLQGGGALASARQVGVAAARRLPFMGRSLGLGGSTHAELRGGGGTQQLCCLRPDGPRRGGWAGAGWVGPTGSAQSDRIVFFLFFRNIFQCISNSRKSPENTLKHEK